MGRILGIVLFVAALWFVANQYAGVGTPIGADDLPTARPTDKARDAVLQAQREAEERRNRLLQD